MCQAVENRGAQLLALVRSRRFGLAGEGAIAVKRNGDQRGDGIDRKWVQSSPDQQSTDRRRTETQRPPGEVQIVIILVHVEIAGVPGHLFSVGKEGPKDIDGVEIRIKDRDRV